MEKNSVAEGFQSGGNTSPPSDDALRAKVLKKNSNIGLEFCFTVFMKDQNVLCQDLLPQFQCFQIEYNCKVVAGLETCPSTGRKHAQCFVRFPKKSRGFGRIKKYWPDAHIEVARGGVNHNLTYCTKENNVIFCNLEKLVPLINGPEEFFNKFERDLNELLGDHFKVLLREFVLREMFVNKSTKVLHSSSSQNDFINSVSYYMGVF